MVAVQDKYHRQPTNLIKDLIPEFKIMYYPMRQLVLKLDEEANGDVDNVEYLRHNYANSVLQN